MFFTGQVPAARQVPATGQDLAEKQAPPPKKNVLILMTDQQSADAMSNIAGEEYLHTPVMDHLAGNGIQFTRAYCANPLCMPSRASMFTGRYPHELGIQDNRHKTFDAGSIPTMGTLFSGAGYETGYVGKWHLPFPKSDEASHGFQWMENAGLGVADSLLPGSAIRFIRRKREKPFLLVVSFINPHNICEWARGDPLPDGDIGRPPAVSACPPLLPNHAPTRNESDINRDMRRSIQANPKFPVGDFTDAKWREYRWAYYRMVEKVDAYIGEILEALRAPGEMDHTLIVFLSDHGDMQGAHRWNQKTVFYEESSRVPFILSGKGLPVKRSDALINTGIDLIPTICAYAGVQLPEKENLPGSNALQPDPTRRYVVVSNRLAVGKNIFPGRERFEPEGRMVRSERFKYWIYDDGEQRESLFDLTSDPGEMHDLARLPEFKTELERHRRYLEEWAEIHHDQKAKEMLTYPGL